MPQRFETPTYNDARPIVCPTIQNLRDQTPPTFVGNTVFAGTPTYALAFVIGSTAAFDGTAAVYAWDASSAAADNGTTVLAPTSPQAGGNPGRWRRCGGTL